MSVAWGGPEPRATRVRASLVIVMLAAVAVPAAGQCTLVEEGTAWLFHRGPEPPGWSEPGHEDDPALSEWELGCAPFGSAGCGFTPRTTWPVGATWFLRQHVYLTGEEFEARVQVAIDNDFELFVNGAPVTSLAKEGCATRWDRDVPIPDGLWLPGDNVVAVKIVDRGGIATFELRLTCSSTGPCPGGCAQLPCDAPGPDVRPLTAAPCPGRAADIATDAAWALQCPTALEYRFRSADGARVLRSWGSGDWSASAREQEDGVLVEARCDHSPTCPGAATLADFRVIPGPPPPLDSVLRVTKQGGLARVDWSGGRPLDPGEHHHLWAGASARQPLRHANGEGDTETSWLDPQPRGDAVYVVRLADSCERETE